MLIYLHVLLLVLLLFATPPLFLVGRNGPTRSIYDLPRVMLPFLGVAVPCILVAPSYHGGPFIEWALPMLLVFIFFWTCRTPLIFNRFWWSLFFTMVVLCANFFILVGCFNFSKRTNLLLFMERASRALTKQAAQESLRNAFPPDQIIDQGPVAAILDDPRYNHCKVTVIEMQWHSAITGLLLLKHEERPLWYPGGPIELGIQGLDYQEP